MTPLVFPAAAARAWIVAPELGGRLWWFAAKKSGQKPHASLPSLLFRVSRKARTSRRMPLPDRRSDWRQVGQFSLMAPLGQTATQAPQPRHNWAFTLTAVSHNVIASVGQTAWQAAHGVQASSSTRATGIVMGAWRSAPPLPAKGGLRRTSTTCLAMRSSVSTLAGGGGPRELTGRTAGPPPPARWRCLADWPCPRPRPRPIPRPTPRPRPRLPPLPGPVPSPCGTIKPLSRGPLRVRRCVS